MSGGVLSCHRGGHPLLVLAVKANTCGGSLLDGKLTQG